MTTVDLVVPAYAPADQLDELVTSVRAQTDANWRLTLLDDAYPDTALASWSSGLDDPRIRYVRHRANIGLNRNFAACLEHAQEDLVAFVGSDDLLLPEYVATVRRAHRRHPRAAMIQPGVEVVDAGGQVRPALADHVKRRVYAPRGCAETVLAGEALATSLLRGNWLYFPSLCWRTEEIRSVGFAPDLHTLLDLDAELALVERGASLVRTPEVCFRYRRHRASVSSWRALDGSRFAEERAFFAGAADRMAGRGWLRAERAARRHVSSRLNALALLPIAVRAGQTHDARALLHHGLGAR